MLKDINERDVKMQSRQTSDAGVIVIIKCTATH